MNLSNEAQNPSGVTSESPLNRASEASTPRPWQAYEINGIIYLKAKNYPRILVTVESLLDGIDNEAREAETQANAELIVKAVNSHDALVEALKAELNQAGHTWACGRLNTPDPAEPCRKQCERVRAALKLTEG